MPPPQQQEEEEQRFPLPDLSAAPQIKKEGGKDSITMEERQIAVDVKRPLQKFPRHGVRMLRLIILNKIKNKNKNKILNKIMDNIFPTHFIKRTINLICTVFIS